MKIHNLFKFISILTLLILLFTFVICQACKVEPIEPTFGELTISENIDNETCAPINPKNRFDIEVEEIYVSMKSSGVKVQDNYSFKYINEKTGKQVTEYSGNYSDITTIEEGFIEGYCVDRCYKESKEDILFEPGDYMVEFYHNSELIGSANFKILEPIVQIEEVVLSKDVNEDNEPIEPTTEFDPDDTLWTCVKLNCTNIGDTLGVKWYYEYSEPIFEDEFTLTEYILDPVYYSWYLYYPEGEIFLPGNYYVEVYLNDSLHDSYDFFIGKDVPVNIVTYDLVEDGDWQNLDIKNTFDNVLYRVEFTGWSNFEDNPDRWCAIAIYIHSFYPVVTYSSDPSLILYSNKNLISMETGKRAINEDRNIYPDAILEEVAVEDIYEIVEFDREFMIAVDECEKSSGNWWFTNLVLSVLTRYKKEAPEKPLEEVQADATGETLSEDKSVQEQNDFDYDQMKAEQRFLDNVYNLLQNEYEPAVNHMNVYHGEEWIFNDPNEIALEETYLEKLKELTNKLAGFPYPNSYSDGRNNLLNIANEMFSMEELVIQCMKNNDYDGYVIYFDKFYEIYTRLHDDYNRMSDSFNAKYN